MSIDGFLDDASEQRLVLSNEADLDRVDAVRASCDAILVGATTVRNDNPRLLVRSRARRDARVGRGLAPNPLKVTMTATAKLDPEASFFTCGDSEKLVYTSRCRVEDARLSLGHVATVVDGGDPVEPRWISEDLRARGVRRLMVEGGGATLTQFLAADLADELHLVVAPFFVGDTRAVRVVGDGPFPWNAARRGTLLDVQRIDDLVLLRYALSRRCPRG
jgi:5-amino-6-(5-phosphoribosylamino)uracil reductase